MPKQNLSDRFLASAACPPERDQEDFRDTNRNGPGLALRVSKGGKKSWCVFYRLNGRERRITVGRYPAISLVDARKLAREISAKAHNGIDPAAERQSVRSANEIARANTVSAVMDRYLEVMRQRGRRERSISDFIGRFRRHILPVLGDTPIADVTEQDVRRLLAPIEEHQQITTRNRVLTHLRALLKWAGVTPDPTARIDKIPEQPKDFTYSKSQLAALFEALHADRAKIEPITALAIRFAAATLKRSSEVAGARFDELDLEEHVWRIPRDRTKAKRPDVVPLSGLARQIIEAARYAENRPVGEVEMRFVFASPSNPEKCLRADTLSKAMRRAVDHAGIEHPQATLHSLRDTGATWLAMHDVQPHIVSGVLGHSPATMAASPITSKYQHYDYLAERRQALEAWGEHLRSLQRVAEPTI